MTTRRQHVQAAIVFVLAAGSLQVLVGSRVRAGSISSFPQQMPAADAQQLWQHISKANPYSAWKTLPNLPRYLQVKENPHGDWVAVYLNKEAYDSIYTPSSPFKMKYGSIIVKENYSLSKSNPLPQPPLTAVPVTLTSLTVMYKVQGYQSVPGAEEWFWVMYNSNNGQPDGSVAIISNQPFVNEPIPLSKDTFAFYKGAVVAGKPWLCLECHQRASQADEFAFGDYLWKVKYFSPK